MKTKFYRLALLLIFCIVLCLSNSAFANQDMTGLFNAPSNGGTGLQTGLKDLTQWIFWIFYLLGSIFLGVGAFKLKQGDIGGFSKNMAGGATLFFVPAVIKVFRTLGQAATTGS